MHHLSLILITIVVWAVSGCADNKPAPPGDQKDFTPEVLYQNPLMQQFSANHPGLAVLKYAQADLDNDGKEDLIVIYRMTVEKNQMCVLRHRGPEIIETNSVPAPVSDQMIQFRNIDEKPPLEFILQGRKGAKVGYAIFRIEKGQLTDLFGEGMEDCC
jgi:hypothetical protein